MQLASLDFVSKQETSTGAAEFEFAPRRPFSFRAGQSVLIQVRGGGIRPFTISADSRSGQISVATMLQSQTRFKRALGCLAAGDSVRAMGPMGNLPTLDPSVPQVLVAQAIGITPFLSMARSARVPNARLLHVGDPHFFEETAEGVRSASHFSHRAGLFGSIDREIDVRVDDEWTISGSRAFVQAIAARLERAGVRRACVHQDAFWGLDPREASINRARAAAR